MILFIYALLLCTNCLVKRWTYHHRSVWLAADNEMALQPDQEHEADDSDQPLCLPDLIISEFPEVPDVPPEVQLYTVRNGCQFKIVIILTTSSLMNTAATISQTFLALHSHTLLIRGSSMPLVKRNPLRLTLKIVRL